MWAGTPLFCFLSRSRGLANGGPGSLSAQGPATLALMLDHVRLPWPLSVLVSRYQQACRLTTYAEYAVGVLESPVQPQHTSGSPTDHPPLGLRHPPAALTANVPEVGLTVARTDKLRSCLKTRPLGGLPKERQAFFHYQISRGLALPLPAHIPTPQWKF